MEEKLESALKSKSFFKEQWARALREINHIKNEYQQNIQIQIKHNKEELRNLG
jgi:centrosomal protein CEP120